MFTLQPPRHIPTLPLRTFVRSRSARHKAKQRAGIAQPPYGADRLKAALARRLDRMTRQMELIERHVTISNEALAEVERRCRVQKSRAATGSRGTVPAVQPDAGDFFNSIGHERTKSDVRVTSG